MSTPEIAAFLAARLGEDEAWAKAALLRRFAPIPQAMERPDTVERVLADVQAKRAILERHRPHDPDADLLEGCTVCLSDREGYRDDWQPDLWPCATLRHLASVYADHPDYRDEWRP